MVLFLPFRCAGSGVVNAARNVHRRGACRRIDHTLAAVVRIVDEALVDVDFDLQHDFHVAEERADRLHGAIHEACLIRRTGERTDRAQHVADARLASAEDYLGFANVIDQCSHLGGVTANRRRACNISNT